MRLVKIKDGRSTDRSASYQELITNYIFPNGKPRKFIPGEYYAIGDVVYIINNENYAILYQCDVPGTYTEITNKYWHNMTETEEIMSKIRQYLGLQDDESKVMEFSHTGYGTGGLTVTDDDKIILPESYSTDDHVEFFLRGHYQSQDLGDYKIVKSNGRYVIESNIESIDSSTEYVVNIVKPLNHNAKLLGYCDYNPTTVDDHELFFMVDDAVVKNSVKFDLYIEGILVPAQEYTYQVVSDGNFIAIDLGESEYVETIKICSPGDIKLVTTSSRSSSILIDRQSYQYEIKSDVECYRLDIDRYIDTENIHVYINNVAIPNGCIYVSDGVLSITEEEYYGKVGDIVTIISDTFDVSINTIKSKSESIVVGANEYKIPIPIINYDENVHDIIIFKESGIHISRSRYYVKDGYVVFYDHDTSLVPGESLYFQVFNEDNSVSISSKIVPAEDSSKVMIPSNFDGNTESFLLYRMNGTYINKTLYKISEDGTYISLSPDLVLDEDECIEFVFNDYLSQYTNTLTKVGSAVLSTDNVVQLPINHYDSTMYNTIVFNNKLGSYIDNSRYSVSEDGVLTITNGTGLSAGDSIDVYVIVNLYNQISIAALALSIASL